MAQYIDKDAAIAEIKRLKMDIGNIFNEYDEGFWDGRDTAFDDAICAFNTLEVKEELVSEELEEAAKDYSNNLDNIYGSMGEQTRNTFKAGAKWQKEQLMSKAVNGVEIKSRRSDGRCILSGNFSRFDTGDKVKLIIIKQE